MKTIGIEIDGPLRDYLEQFDAVYRKVFIHNPALVEVSVGGQTFEERSDVSNWNVKELSEEENDQISDRIEQLERELINLPVDSFDLLNHYRFEPRLDDDGITMLTPQQSLEKFMFEEHPFKIFGKANEFKDAFETINRLQAWGLNNKKFDIILLSTLRSKAIPPTYHFLASNACRVKKVAFVDNDIEKWKMCDVLIDVNPQAFQNKPKNKTSIKINKPYNQWDDADYSFENIKQIMNNHFLEQIFP